MEGTRILSIIIPTYNRKERLLNQLQSIYNQPLSENVEIVISDNHSDYDVLQAVKECFGEVKTKNLTVSKNPANIGLALNIAIPFLLCKTRWLWILSDDDQTLDGSLELIFQDINQYSEMAVIKYSLGNITRHHNEVFTKLEELICYYERPDKSQGEFIFISNGLFNMDILESIKGDLFAYSYNAIAGIMPLVLSLDKALGKVLMRDRDIVQYLPPDAGSNWNYYKITISLVALVDYPYNANGKLVNRLMGLMNNFRFYAFLESIIQLNDKTKAKIYYRKTFDLVFQGSLLKRMQYRFLYYVYYCLGINMIPYLRRIKHMVYYNNRALN